MSIEKGISSPKQRRLVGATANANQHARWVEAFTAAWRAPTDAQALVQQFDPWLQPNYRFDQPLSRRPGTGSAEFRRRFAQPLFAVMTDIHGAVESWAAHGDTLFIELTVKGSVGRHRVRLQACDRVTLSDGLAADRRTYVDVLPLIAAIARTPRLWPTAVRWQLDEIVGAWAKPPR